MLDPDTFLTTLYVMADDFCQSELPPEAGPGRHPSLSRSEVVTLALFGQWQIFASEQAFYRWAKRHLRPAFPRLPAASQFNRLLRRAYPAIVAFFHHLVRRLDAQRCPFEALDSTAAPTRAAKRRGRGWLAGLADLGWSNRLGWDEGFHLLVAVNPQGILTGFAFGPASAADQPLAEQFFLLRCEPHPAFPTVGAPAQGPYATDKGFEGEANHQRWRQEYGAQVLCPPRRNSSRPWPKWLRRWLSGLRQLVETAHAKLHHTFRLEQERPHCLAGFQARLAAKMALYNFCVWLNQQLGRPPLAFADLLAW
jgi:Transposase DDE domain